MLKDFTVHELEETKDIVNAEFANNGYKKHWFLPVESGNLMTIYMHIIFEGTMCLPSLIGIPKLLNKSNHRQMLNQDKDYSCIRFFTPFRNNKKICDQPLRLFFENDTEQVEFLSNNIFIVDKQNPNYSENTLIQNPLIVLLDLSKVIYVLKNRYREFILDPSILEPLRIQQITGTCLNMTNLHAHITMDMDSKTNTNTNSGTSKKRKTRKEYQSLSATKTSEYWLNKRNNGSGDGFIGSHLRI